jgi:uncharacterized protein (TIGR03118 family)
VIKRTIALLSAVPLLLLGAATTAHAAHGGANRYRVTNLVSDQANVATHRDRRLVNAWGLAAGPSSPWWVADNGTDRSTLYDGAGKRVPLVVSVPGAPTGLVFNGGPNFVVSDGTDSGPSVFLFDTEGGKIRGWNPGVPPPPFSTKTFTVVNRSGQDAIFKGLAIASAAHRDFIYATDFHNRRVDVFNGAFHQVHRPGAFMDPDIPRHFAPFGIQELGGKIYVTYAKQDADAEDDVSGHGLGFVDVFDLHGNLIDRVASRGPLNAPWGLAWAPADFGEFSGDLLVGNFGNGKINAYAWTASGFELEGRLRRGNGAAVAVDGLWGLGFGNDGPAGSSDTLYFTAGPDDESHGLFGSIEAVH